MVRVADKGDLYVHQGESRYHRDERERAAIGKASREACVRPATCPQEVSTTRTTGGANWNVIGLILDSPRQAKPACCEATPPQSGVRRVKDSLVERHTYTPYGILTIDQETSFGDRDADGDVDSTDKGTPGTDCTGTVTGACRILDLDPALDTSPRAEHTVAWRQPRVAGRDESRVHGDYDSTDATLFDSLPQGLAIHPGRTATSVDQPFAHQGLLHEPEIGSYQNRARQYHPGTRRFLQRDPAQYAGGMGFYEYIASNPTNGVDPSGALRWETLGGPGAVVLDTACGGIYFEKWVIMTSGGVVVQLAKQYPWPVPGAYNCFGFAFDTHEPPASARDPGPFSPPLPADALLVLMKDGWYRVNCCEASIYGIWSDWYGWGVNSLSHMGKMYLAQRDACSWEFSEYISYTMSKHGWCTNEIVYGTFETELAPGNYPGMYMCFAKNPPDVCCLAGEHEIPPNDYFPMDD